jgi:tetrahydromethanopterin S-methyltransferase subunit E
MQVVVAAVVVAVVLVVLQEQMLVVLVELAVAVLVVAVVFNLFNESLRLGITCNNASLMGKPVLNWNKPEEISKTKMLLEGGLLDDNCKFL